MPDWDACPDGDLLEAFVSRRSEDAFAEIVRRHSPMVLGVCRRHLEAEAEDAAQAVFLILSRKADSLRGKRDLAAWLHHVAWNVAQNARRSAARRRAREREVARMRKSLPDPDVARDRERLRPVLDRALAALPDRYRIPLILHHLEGVPPGEAAARLGCTEGAWSVRLTRAREALRASLARQGVVLTGVALAAALSPAAFATSIPASFVGAAAKAGLLALSGGPALAGTVAPSVLELAKGVSSMTAMAKLKLAAVAVAAVFLSPAAGYLAVRAVAAGGGAGEVRSSEAPAQAAVPDPRRPVPEAIRVEAVRSPADPVGRPLPLAAAWTCMFILKQFESPQQKIDTQFWSPAWQLEQIRAGHHILPFLPIYDRVDEDPFRELAALGLPFSLASLQWEADLSKPPYIGLPPERNPNVVTVEGRIEPRVSPFGPLEPWREMGKKVASVPRLQSAQKTYPEPPLVLFISNNEHGKLWWHEAEKERRYLDRYGKGRPDEFKRKVVGDGWIERYKELIAGIRDHLTAPSWKKNMRAVAYDALVGYDAYRWGGWIEYSLYVPGRVEPWPLCWDGASPSYYVFDWNASTDFKVWSPQIGAMSWVNVVEEARKLNPGFWWEISTWDGHDPGTGRSKRREYEKAGQNGGRYPPERYGGFIQFGLWLTHPRCVRDFRYIDDSAEMARAMFGQVLEAVDRVHVDPILRRFWRKGTLVANRERRHPWSAGLPEEYRDRDRWFLLNTNLDPPRWTNEAVVPVFALAHVLKGTKGAEWLVYAHSPLEDRRDVQIDIPGYGKVMLDVPVSGAFYHLPGAGLPPVRVGLIGKGWKGR